MGKIVVFKGSPRKNGYSTKLVEQVISGAKDAGAEVITYDLNDDGIKGCQAVFIAGQTRVVLQKTICKPCMEN